MERMTSHCLFSIAVKSRECRHHSRGSSTKHCHQVWTSMLRRRCIILPHFQREPMSIKTIKGAPLKFNPSMSSRHCTTEPHIKKEPEPTLISWDHYRSPLWRERLSHPPALRDLTILVFSLSICCNFVKLGIELVEREMRGRVVKG